jgi:hypothetical protein
LPLKTFTIGPLEPAETEIALLGACTGRFRDSHEVLGKFRLNRAARTVLGQLSENPDAFDPFDERTIKSTE